MTVPLKPYAPGLGSTVIEYPAGAKRQQSAPEPKAAAVHKLDLLKHLPDGDFKQYVGDVAKMCSIHANTALLVGLGIVSSVTSRVYAVQYQNGETLPTGEYVIAGGLPGDAKSRLLKAFQNAVFNAQKDAVKAYRAEEKAFEEDSENEDKKFKKPYPIKIFITDTTAEALEPVLKESDGFFSLASAEQAVVNTLLGASYGGEGRKNNNDLSLKGFNGEYHASSRARRDGYIGYVVGSITCFAQPAAIFTILDKSEGSGVAERFMMIIEPTQQGTRDFTKPHHPQEYSKNVYNRIVKDIAAQAINDPKSFDELQSWRISKTDWMKIYLYRNEIEPQLLEGGKYSAATLRGMAAKVDMHVMKISSLLACLYDHPVGEIPSMLIDAAIGIVRDMLEYTYRLLIELDVIGTNAYEESVIAFLGDKTKTHTRTSFQQAKAKVKPWSELPKGGKGQVITDTFDGLEAKGIIWKNQGTGIYQLIA